MAAVILVMPQSQSTVFPNFPLIGGPSQTYIQKAHGWTFFFVYIKNKDDF